MVQKVDPRELVGKTKGDLGISLWAGHSPAVVLKDIYNFSTKEKCALKDVPVDAVFIGVSLINKQCVFEDGEARKIRLAEEAINPKFIFKPVA